jgi:hydroxymethylglutaryl-CoA reductase
MNGIDAIGVALGQDFRALESGAHAYAAMKNKYLPLTHYEIQVDEMGEEYFVGSLELPIAVGSKGGSIGTNPVYKMTHYLASYPSAKEISMLMVSVGLAQNFAALRALSIEGIQKGHMNLHAK